MAHAAIAYAKALNRKRAMAVTTSIGPGALNMVTAAALAHVNRLPVLLIPGDVFANRAPDPVLQQVEDFGDGTVSANDAFRPVSRYFDRITRPEQLLTALPRAFATMTDPADCGPVTLAFCQDVQAEAYDWPAEFFAPQGMAPPPPAPRRRASSRSPPTRSAARSARSSSPAAASSTPRPPARSRPSPRSTTSPSARPRPASPRMPWDHPLNLGSIGVTGSSATNAVAEAADVVLAVGTRLQDFTTGSWALFQDPDRRIVSINVTPYDAHKHNALPLIADARLALEELSAAPRRPRASPTPARSRPSGPPPSTP